jgi:hypothetical protein
MSRPDPRHVPPPDAPAAPTRWLNRLTTALLALSIAIAVGAATPALLRAAGSELVPRDAPPLSAPPIAMPRRPPEILGHEGEPERLFEPDGESDGTPRPGPRGQLGLTRGPLVLHERAADSAGMVGAVQGGEMVTVLRIAGDWALVYYGGADGLVVGWAKKSEIAIR